MKRKLYLIAGLLLCCSVTGCRNPWMEKLVGHLINDDAFYVPRKWSWDGAVAEIENLATETDIKNFRIILTGNISINASQTATFDTTSDISISITGNKTINLNDTGSLLYISSGQTVTIKGVHLRGRGIVDPNDENMFSLVTVDGGTFTMQSKSLVSGNNNAIGSGGGVVVINGGTFTMTGGTISQNIASNNGGGVHVDSALCSFTMTGGAISQNTAQTGGGVHVNNGKFYMTGGKVHGENDPGLSNIIVSGGSGGKALYVSNGTAYIIGYADHTAGHLADTTIP